MASVTEYTEPQAPSPGSRAPPRNEPPAGPGVALGSAQEKVTVQWRNSGIQQFSRYEEGGSGAGCGGASRHTLDPLWPGGRVGQAGRGSSEVLRPEAGWLPNPRGLGLPPLPWKEFLAALEGMNGWSQSVGWRTAGRRWNLNKAAGGPGCRAKHILRVRHPAQYSAVSPHLALPATLGAKYSFPSDGQENQDKYNDLSQGHTVSMLQVGGVPGFLTYRFRHD